MEKNTQVYTTTGKIYEAFKKWVEKYRKDPDAFHTLEEMVEKFTVEEEAEGSAVLFLKEYLEWYDHCVECSTVKGHPFCKGDGMPRPPTGRLVLTEES